MALKVAIIGAGSVGSKLGSKLAPPKFNVKYGARDPASAKVKEVLAAQPTATADTVDASIAWADVVVLATPGAHTDTQMKDLAASLGPNIKGKVLVDVTNPLSAYPGLEVRWTNSSGGEALQALLPDTHVFKAFNTIGAEHMTAGDGSLINGQQLSMLYAGGSEGKEHVEAFISGVGYRPEYVGPIRYARNLEAIAELWIHLGVPGVGTSAKWDRNFHFQVIRKD